jgi:uncharacterized membrane protein
MKSPTTAFSAFFTKLGLRHLSIALAMLVAIGSVTVSAGCKKKKNKVTPVCDGTNATYNSTVKSIINANCVSCHSNYSSYSGLSGIISNGQFNQHVQVDQDMPKDGDLSTDELNKIQCWVDAGYPEN